MNSLERYRQRVRDVENSPDFLVEDVKLSFAEELTRLLADQHVSRTELADRMRTSRAYVTRILRTDYNLTVLTMVKVASALNARVSLHLRPVEAERTQWSAGGTVSATQPVQSEQDAPVVSDKPATRPSKRPGRV
jgi:transcriptional regulator with XRE-family HTH domain